MIARADDHIKIAGDSAVPPSVSLSGDTDALAVPRTRLNPHLERFAFGDSPFAVAGWARGEILSGAVATRTRHIKLHAAAGLRNLPSAIALRTLAGRFKKPLTMAGGASVLPGDVEPHNAAADRRPEGNVDLIFELGSGLGTLIYGGACAAPTTEDSREDVAEAAASASGAATGIVHHVGEIEAAEVEVNALPAARLRPREAAKTTCARSSAASIRFGRCGIDIVRVEADLIVDLSLLGIAQDVVGLGNCFKLLFRRLVPRIDVRMILARQFAESLADVLGRGRLLHAEGFVVVLLGGGGHLAQSEIGLWTKRV